MSDSIPAYDLKDIIIHGDVIQARPIQWDGKIYDGFGNDENGNPVQPISWVTTCPKCGNMVQFGIKDVVGSRDGIDIVHCQQCVPSEVPPEPEPEPVPIGELVKIQDPPEIPAEELVTTPSTPAVMEAKKKEKAVTVSAKPQVSAPALDVGPTIEVNIPEHKELKTSIDTNKSKPYEPKAPVPVVSKPDAPKSPAPDIHTNKVQSISLPEEKAFVDPIKAGLMKLDE